MTVWVCVCACVCVLVLIIARISFSFTLSTDAVIFYVKKNKINYFNLDLTVFKYIAIYIYLLKVIINYSLSPVFAVAC